MKIPVGLEIICIIISVNAVEVLVFFIIIIITVFVPLAAQGAYQSHFRWALYIKILISRFFSLKLVIFEKKINGK